MTSSLLYAQQIRTISTNTAPAPAGPYVQAIAHGSTVFVSGQLPIDPETGRIESQDPGSQSQQCLKNIANILKSAGSAPPQILKATIFLTNAEDLTAVNSAYSDFFDGQYPARSCVVVSALPHPQARVEIEAVAVRPPQTSVEAAV
jgi:2-iminobutanoate/2-iminopropanoate deaminase